MGKLRLWGGLAFCVFTCFGILLSGCGSAGKEQPIAIFDGFTETRLFVAEGTTVGQALEEAEIAVGKGDLVSPALKEPIGEGGSQIQIGRRAHVVVEEKGKTREITMTGKKVGDALKEAGIALREHDVVNHGLEAYLADGMEIVVTRRLLVKLTVDGREEEFLTEADTVEGLLKEQGIRLDKMDKITPLPGERLADGAEVVVQRVSVKEVAQREPIPYGTRTEYSDSLFEGETVQKQQGKPGEKEVVYQVTYVDGEEESRTPISERTIQEPVSAVIVKGTKKRRRVISKEARKGYGGFSVCGQEAVNRSDREKLWEPLQNFSGRGYGVCLKVQEKFGL